jgi:epoxyqueuosine reductase
MNASQIKSYARELGFDFVGVAPIAPGPESSFYGEWLDHGYAGEMAYLHRQKAERLDPTTLLAGARSVIVCAINYNTDWPTTRLDRMRAWISRYAWGDDYHGVLQTKLNALATWIDSAGDATNSRAYVDGGPVLERVYAKYAGVGWFGKNTCIINQNGGSWLFLGCVFTTLDLAYDRVAPDRCGSCTRCLDACPTDAFVAPYTLDSRKCISYTTIELRGAIPESDREGIGHHLFGCDICQDVCPWNRKAPASTAPSFQPRDGLFWPELETLLNLDETGWRNLIRGSAMKRAKLKGLLRNLMVVVGNSGARRLIPSVARFLLHEDEHVRSHAEWAMRRLRGGTPAE